LPLSVARTVATSAAPASATSAQPNRRRIDGHNINTVPAATSGTKMTGMCTKKTWAGKPKIDVIRTAC
jgi:CBS-domain-containing membrane protein